MKIYKRLVRPVVEMPLLPGNFAPKTTIIDDWTAEELIAEKEAEWFDKFKQTSMYATLKMEEKFIQCGEVDI